VEGKRGGKGKGRRGEGAGDGKGERREGEEGERRGGGEVGKEKRRNIGQYVMFTLSKCIFLTQGQEVPREPPPPPSSQEFFRHTFAGLEFLFKSVPIVGVFQ
jgi:hypothetical protein